VEVYYFPVVNTIRSKLLARIGSISISSKNNFGDEFLVVASDLLFYLKNKDSVSNTEDNNNNNNNNNNNSDYYERRNGYVNVGYLDCVEACIRTSTTNNNNNNNTPSVQQKQQQTELVEKVEEPIVQLEIGAQRGNKPPTVSLFLCSDSLQSFVDVVSELTAPVSYDTDNNNNNNNNDNNNNTDEEVHVLLHESLGTKLIKNDDKNEKEKGKEKKRRKRSGRKK